MDISDHRGSVDRGVDRQHRGSHLVGLRLRRGAYLLVPLRGLRRLHGDQRRRQDRRGRGLTIQTNG